jgi:hypothetical protein
VPRPDCVHFWWSNANPPAVERTWRWLEKLGLADALTIIEAGDGRFHGHAPCYPFMPLEVVRAWLEAPDGPGRLAWARRLLKAEALAAAFYRQTYDRHRQLALARGWVC